MAEHRIKAGVFPLRKLFDGVTYAIESYQREYEWSTEHVQILSNDLFEEFENAERRGAIRRWGERPAQ